EANVIESKKLLERRSPIGSSVSREQLDERIEQISIKHMEQNEEYRTTVSPRLVMHTHRPPSNLLLPRLTSSNSDQPIDWNEVQVEKWLRLKQVSVEIHRNITPCDGKILYQIYSMLIDAPEFFYVSISSRNGRDV